MKRDWQLNARSGHVFPSGELSRIKALVFIYIILVYDPLMQLIFENFTFMTKTTW